MFTRSKAVYLHSILSKLVPMLRLCLLLLVLGPWKETYGYQGNVYPYEERDQDHNPNPRHARVSTHKIM